MRARDAIARAFEGTDDPLSADDVVARVRAVPGGDRWADTTLRTVLRALAPNAVAGRHYPTERRHGFLFALGGGRYRRWDVASDGPLEAARLAHEGRRRGRRVATPPSSRDLRARLVRRLVEAVHEDAYQPSFRRRPHGETVVGWPGRLTRYFWPHPVMDVRATHELLSPWFAEAGALARRLEAGATWTDGERRRATVLAWQMLAWGGVTQQRAFGPSVVEQVFCRALGMPGGKSAPMNSGWTKVAALATAHREGDPVRAPHVIWDSRVSTSIVWRLDELLGDEAADVSKRVFPRIGAVPGRGGKRLRPRPLRRPWAHAYRSWSAQEAGSVLVREIRDVLNGGDYGWMPLPQGGEGTWTIRGVESVLFMDGY